jgi:hypothetical protein
VLSLNLCELSATRICCATNTVSLVFVCRRFVSIVFLYNSDNWQCPRNLDKKLSVISKLRSQTAKKRAAVSSICSNHVLLETCSCTIIMLQSDHVYFTIHLRFSLTRETTMANLRRFPRDFFETKYPRRRKDRTGAFNILSSLASIRYTPAPLIVFTLAHLSVFS